MVATRSRRVATKQPQQQSTPALSASVRRRSTRLAHPPPSPPPTEKPKKTPPAPRKRGRPSPQAKSSPVVLINPRLAAKLRSQTKDNQDMSSIDADTAVASSASGDESADEENESDSSASSDSEQSETASDYGAVTVVSTTSESAQEEESDDDMAVESLESESDFETIPEPAPRRPRARAAAPRSARPIIRVSSDNESESEEAPESLQTEPSVPKTLIELMPLFTDMKLVIGLQPLPEPKKPRSRSADASTSDQQQQQQKKRKTGKSSKPKKKLLREILEGDLTDPDEPGVIDPRSLPEDDVDHSKYSMLFRNHPHLRHVWSSMGRQIRIADKVSQPPELKIKLLPFQQEGVWWMTQQEQSIFHGGILADEMGMGKTLQTIALLLINRGKSTLVICPTVALMQWKAEIEAATDALSVLLYYGDERKKILDSKGAVDAKKLAQYDVILTTFAVMESGFRREHMGYRQKGMLRRETSVLHSINWFRVVLDEAHNIKDRSSNSARAAFALTTQRVWSLTGTPLHNRIGELYSLIRMSKTDPFSMYFCHLCPCKSLKWHFENNSKDCHECGHRFTTHFCFWNKHILNPIQQNSVTTLESKMGFQKLGRLLDNIMLRRTKEERSKDMGLPPRIIVTRRDKFSPAEEDFYVSLFSNYQREFDTYAQHGTVLNNYANIFELITRMRLAANHPDLLRLKVDANAKVGADSSDTLVCAICNEEAEDPIISRCKHVFCRVDAQMYVSGADESTTLRCPMCFALFDIDLTQPEMVQSTRSRGGGGGGGGRSASSDGPQGVTLMESMMSTPKTLEYRRSIVNRIDMSRWRSSTKIEALVEELSKHRQSNANIKSIVFSQFVNFLDLIQWRLNRAGFSVCRLDGRMSPSQRDAVIRTFMTQPEYTVFLVSLKAGGVALNLTEASNVYLADCWWNPSVEMQAMDRIHRMGQYRPIKVTRIIVENSIESRIIALQVKKQHLVNSTIGRDKKSLDHLSEQDMQFLFSA
ncbi:DNA repair protein rad16 [Coemansia sp. Benny D115]|nr:DNA repair protein rad16 [Coemansia sp. Benny D115]